MHRHPEEEGELVFNGRVLTSFIVQWLKNMQSSQKPYEADKSRRPLYSWPFQISSLAESAIVGDRQGEYATEHSLGEGITMVLSFSYPSFEWT